MPGLNQRIWKKLEDLGKLPFMVKTDLRDNYPSGCVPFLFLR